MSPKIYAVIPGRRQRIRATRGPMVTNPESRGNCQLLDSGFARATARAPRNDVKSVLLRLAREALQQFLDLAVLLALAVGPFADHLLLGPHMRDQALNRLREVGHRSGGAAVVAAFLHGGAQALDGVLQVAAGP